MNKNEKIEIPRFKNEKEEAEWWDAHPEIVTRLFDRAIERGEVQRRRTETRTVTMRIPVSDIETARHLAENKGIPYQTYIKMLLREALQKELKAKQS